LEFKPSARWDLYQNRLNPDLQKGICKTVAAFLNTEGGTLLIGIADNARVLGLKQDFATLQKPKSDDYCLFLHNLLFDNLGKDLGSCLDIAIVRLRDKEICRVVVRRSPRPVYIKEGNNDLFFVRVGNSSRNLPLKAVVEYCKTRWAGNSPVWL
jgi:predicted HTH transcriptional regulator